MRRVAIHVCERMSVQYMKSRGVEVKPEAQVVVVSEIQETGVSGRVRG